MENEKIAKAVDKLDDEVTNGGNTPELQAISDMLKDLLREDETVCEAVLDKKKTVKSAFEAMRNYAQKHKSGSCYCMVPQEALKVIGEYYGVALTKEESKFTDVCEFDTVSLFDMI